MEEFHRSAFSLPYPLRFSNSFTYHEGESFFKVNIRTLSECLKGVHFKGCKLLQTSGMKNVAVFLISLVLLSSNN